MDVDIKHIIDVNLARDINQWASSGPHTEYNIKISTYGDGGYRFEHIRQLGIHNH